MNDVQDALYPWKLTLRLELIKWATLWIGLYQRLLSKPRVGRLLSTAIFRLPAL